MTVLQRDVESTALTSVPITLDQAFSSRTPTVEPFSDLWFARLIAKKHGQDIRFVPKWDRWYVWNANLEVWCEDSGEVMRFAESVATIEAVDEIERTDLEDESARRSLRRRVQSKLALENAIRLLRSESEIVVSHDLWDRQPHRLCVANGTIDLRTAELKPSKREDYFTKRVPIAFRPDATAPTFDHFLARVLPDPEVREYVNCFLGYSIGGAPHEHVLHVLWGSGANGKSTLIESIRCVLGDYAGTAPSNLLLKSIGERHPTELTTLHGRRLVTCSETPENGRLNESQLKSLTGGDRITARGMRQDFFEFDPTHTLVLLTNHRPQVSGTDEGVWRRLRLVPFNVVVPAHERDSQLVEKLRAEAEGILLWLVRGAQRYYVEGLKPPSAVRNATNEYRADEDHFGEFLKDGTLRESGTFLATGELFSTYQSWCESVGIDVSRRLRQRDLKAQMTIRGYPWERRSKARGFRDLRLRGDSDPVGPAPDPTSEPAEVDSMTHVTDHDASTGEASLHKRLQDNDLSDAVTLVTDNTPILGPYARAHIYSSNGKVRHDASCVIDSEADNASEIDPAPITPESSDPTKGESGEDLEFIQDPEEINPRDDHGDDDGASP